jgi:hypothetical protein
VACSGGVCSASTPNAVLNVTDLQNLLSSGGVTVTSVSQSTDIQVQAALTWSSANSLTLDSFRSIFVGAAVSDAGLGALSLKIDDGGKAGTLQFGVGGSIGFSSVKDTLLINGGRYRLVNSVKSLAAAIALHPSNKFALVKNYDASHDGVYATAPVAGQFGGIFNGLGNTISNLSVSDPNTADAVGLFANLNGTVESVHLVNVAITASGTNPFAGAVAGFSQGKVLYSSSSGTISAGARALAGGVVGQNNGSMSTDFSSANVTAGDNAYVGGLVGFTTGTIIHAAATGAVSVGASGYAGGLVGFNGGFGGTTGGTITNTFTWGSVTGGDNSYLGGFVGDNYSTGGTTGSIHYSYGTGPITGTSTSIVGGFAGYNNAAGPALVPRAPGLPPIDFVYWDTEHSKASTGVGSGDSAGIKGVPEMNKTFMEAKQSTDKQICDDAWSEDAALVLLFVPVLPGNLCP